MNEQKDLRKAILNIDLLSPKGNLNPLMPCIHINIIMC